MKPQAAPPSTSRWWYFADFSVFAAWLVVVGVTLRHHEKWADEAQAWLIARDLDLRTIWFHELRYEGTPGLWHTMLWVAQHVFHAPYAALGVIGMACAAAGVAFMLWKAPFPRPLRYMLAFSYFMVYQYAVISRPYTLLPLLAFLAAYLFHDREHPERMTAALFLLCMLTVHGILIAGGIGVAYLIDIIKGWRFLAKPLRRRYALCIGAMLLTIVFLVLILKPTPDVDTFVKPSGAPQLHRPEISAISKVEATVCGAFLDYSLPSGIFLLLAGAWCFMRRKLLLFALPIVSLTLLYAKIHGVSHHHGTLFVAAMVGVWVAWPSKTEERTMSIGQRRAQYGMIALLVCLFLVNVWDAASSIRHEYLYPYCGAEDAAKYLKTVGADKQSVFGYTYGTAAVQAYFDQNLLANIPTTYYHHGVPAHGDVIDADQLYAAKPEYVVFLSGDPKREIKRFDPRLRSLGYEMVHFSDGYLFFKRSVMDRQVYVIYRRTD